MGFKSLLIGNWQEGVGIGIVKGGLIPNRTPIAELANFEKNAQEYFAKTKQKSYWGTINVEDIGETEIAAFLREHRNEIMIVIDPRKDTCVDTTL